MTDPRFHHPPPAPVPRGGAPRWVIALAVATAVLSVVSFTTVLLWPSGTDPDDRPDAGPLAFQPFQQVARIDFDQPSRTALTQIEQNRVYVAWEQGGNLEVVAADLATGAERWRRRVTGSPRLAQVLPVPGAVVVIGADEDGVVSDMYLLDDGGGAQLWSREVTADDWASATGDTLVWYHEPDAEVRGVDIASGRQEWSQPVSRDAVTTWALTEADLARPTDTEGHVGVVGTDPRLAVVDEDSSGFVVDTRYGTVTSQGHNIARPSAHVLAYLGRLFVASNERGFELVSYDLDDLGGLPQTHYRAGPDSYPQALAACGPQRVCLLETEGFDAATTEAVMIDLAGNGELWRNPVADGRTLVPVGDWLLVVMGTGGPVVGYDAAGQEVLNRPGVAARLNPGNLLVFAERLPSSQLDLSVAGIATAGERPVELGQLPEVVGDQCTWSLLHMVCPDQDGATVWRFAEDP